MPTLDAYEWYPPVHYNLADSPYGPPNPETLELFGALPPNSSILDIAGGYGRYAEPLTMTGHNVTIVDIDPAHLEEAKRRAAALPEGSGQMRAVEADVVADDLSKLGTFDALLCTGFIYLAPRNLVRKVFHSMTKLLRPGGRSVVEFATNRERYDADGNSLIGPGEQNYTLKQGQLLLERMYRETGIAISGLERIVIDLRQPYCLHTDLIIAHGTKT